MEKIATAGKIFFKGGLKFLSSTTPENIENAKFVYTHSNQLPAVSWVMGSWGCTHFTNLVQYI